ncbi:universal stress protein [Pseudomonas sp. SWI6]|uniref:Universal stress protein n=1 Tax=Pseudomonas taiwanensis TaxID=470150 RepID=A0ABR6V1T4_9PSED|nr:MULTISPECIES: universal stress protein [Pseudomonas]AGZ35653.1 UspA domain-containing protein [Pseudomonas sp. VLB120]AVD82896.1 universal stress protein [Pseudomonas sp. SWI6]MBC3474384.1 universal stress protein [Pseudomonas taiwanensis]MBC3489681.1 universal stress protein [Pseudomonas taiwanensis]WEZ86736.1 universal stress protein [Pseudomonas sp. NyZ480]
MSHYQRLLLILRPALRQSCALEQAAALARSSSASLHIVGLLESLDKLRFLETGDHQSERQAYLQSQQAQLEAQAQVLRASGVQVTTEVAWSSDLQADILEHALEMQPDVLLKQVEREPVLKRAFFTPLDWQLLRHCPIPVYLLGAARPALPRQIVAAVDVADPSPEGQARNDSIVQQANALALQTGAQLDLLFACDLTMAYMGDMGYGAWAIGDVGESLRQALEEDFKAVADRYGAPAERRHFILGRPVAVLSEYVETHPVDVIVMGRPLARGLDRLFGSTTEHVLYQIPCNILAV